MSFTASRARPGQTDALTKEDEEAVAVEKGSWMVGKDGNVAVSEQRQVVAG